MRRFVVCGSLLAIRCAFAADAPTLITWQLNPYAQATANVVSAIERVTPTAEGGLVVDVSFSAEPSEAPTVQFVYTSKGSAGGSTSGYTYTQVADETVCSFPTQSMELDGRWTYAYTLPAVEPLDGSPIAHHRLAVMERLRFGGVARRFEGGGYAIIEGDNLYLGRSGTFTIGGQELTFEGGVCLEPSTAVAETVATFSLRTPANDERTIRGKRLAFPVKLKEVEE